MRQKTLISTIRHNRIKFTLLTTINLHIIYVHILLQANKNNSNCKDRIIINVKTCTYIKMADMKGQTKLCTVEPVYNGILL